jgi:hypothetical protein
MSKKKRRGFVRTTISLPAELRRRMKDCGPDVNWSAVAVRAFAAEVGRIQTQRMDVHLDDVVARLRGTQVESRSDQFEKGRIQGEKWAQRQATATQLRRLWAAWRDARRNPGSNSENWLSTMIAKKSAGEVLAKIVGKEWPVPKHAADAERLDSSEYVHGFAAGAIRVWKQVARRLRGET